MVPAVFAERDRNSQKSMNSVLFYIFLGVVMMSSGCDRRSAPKSTVKFWGMGNEGEMVKSLIAEFERRNPDIKVDVQQIPWTAAHEKLLTAFAGESTPDVCQLGNTWLPEFTVLEALEPLDPFIHTSSVVQIPDYFEGVMKTNIIDSIVYGIPWYVDTRVVFYRKEQGIRNFRARGARYSRRAGRSRNNRVPERRYAIPSFFRPTNGFPRSFSECRQGAISSKRAIHSEISAAVNSLMHLQ